MMTQALPTAHHDTDDNAMVERGLAYLRETPRHLRGPCVPALKQLGLSAREACMAARLHHLELARAG